MRVRYKDNPDIERETSRFNIHALAEVDMHDDSAYIRDLEVFVNGQWKYMPDAFKDRDIIPDNSNTYFAIPVSEEAKMRGWND